MVIMENKVLKVIRETPESKVLKAIKEILVNKVFRVYKVKLDLKDQKAIKEILVSKDRKVFKGVHPAAFSLKISHSPNKYVMPRKITKTTVSTIACSR
jgi:hypothetical protein